MIVDSDQWMELVILNVSDKCGHLMCLFERKILQIIRK